MINNIIYNIRENKQLYIFLKYNSYLYKKILRNEINIKELEKIFKENTNNTSIDKIKNIRKKLELTNSILDIMK